MSNTFSVPTMTRRINLKNPVFHITAAALSFMIDGGSVACELSTAHSKYGTRSLCITGVEGDNEIYGVSKLKCQLIPDHYYYACVEAYQEVKLGSVDFFWPAASPSIFGGQATGDAGTWNKYSSVTTRSSFTAGDYPIRLDFNNGGTAGNIWFDGLMLIDLTEAFGAGSEPTNAWCQENIPYFTGTYTIDIPVSSPVQSLVASLDIPDGVVKKITNANGDVLFSIPSTCYLRPSADVSLEHDIWPARLSAGYLTICEEVSDGFSTYINHFSPDYAGNTSTLTSTFIFSGNIPTNGITIKNAKIVVDGGMDDGSIPSSATITVNVGGVPYNITTTFNGGSSIYDITEIYIEGLAVAINDYIKYNSIGSTLEFTVTLSTTCTGYDGKASGEHSRIIITQMYIELTYEY